MKLVRRLMGRSARQGNVALIFAIVAPLLTLGVMGSIDLSEMLLVKQHLQQATDAAALAVSSSDAETPSSTEAQLQTVATNYLAGNFVPTTSIVGGAAVMTSFKLCTTNQTADCTGGVVTNTITITTQVRAPCWAPLELPGVCTSDGRTQLLSATGTANVGMPSSIQWSFILDTSGSMIVGATPSDVQAVETWNNTAANWTAVNDAAGTTPCAFACHDESSQGNVTSGASGSDMDKGITNAHAANATTRYDVTLSATSEAITYIKQQVTADSQLAKNSYYFNIYWMADKLNSGWSATSSQANDWTDASAAVTRANLPVGLDTHISTALEPLTTSSWTGGTGASYSSPKKVVFLITDGLQSDFVSDFSSINANSCGTGSTVDTAWSSQASGASWNCTGSRTQGWSGHYYPNGYATPISTSLCTSIKNNGITLAVLETPYVPLTGQSPALPYGSYNAEFYPYEQFVRHAIYPSGPNTTSAVSTALQACATSPQLYAQASSTDPNSILAGLKTLVNAFLATNAFLKQ